MKLGFTMCNPPFFSDSDYYNPLESKLDSNFFSCSDRSTPGGEYEFIKTMIEESLMLEEEAKHCIIWFTSMIGIKKTVPKIEQFIESKFPDIQTYQTTSYCQGRKTRWYVGWSFVANPASLPKNRLIIFIKDISLFLFLNFSPKFFSIP
uniref:U6 small nuclear RNA (Adenine-(43)-N(6))-methyltransferase (Trinotate prediction) n=1 Tax=Myxobolus squamalis TaxID=59785 RepID=A0A6B2G3R2_MYXSQ